MKIALNQFWHYAIFSFAYSFFFFSPFFIARFSVKVAGAAAWD